MILDNFLMFTGSSNGTSGGLTSGPNTDAPTTGAIFSTNVVDLGVISGLPATAAGGGGARDIGIGDDPAMKLLVVVTSTMAGGASLGVNLQGAPDAGSNTPGAYTTMWTGPVVLLANLTIGAYLANVDVPRTIPGQPLPRYLRLAYIISGTFTGGGSVEGTIVLDRFDQVTSTTGALSGYPPGVVVAN
jgi:hypothetical protein